MEWALQRQKTRVLLVEDHPVNQKVVSRMLDRLSCRVQIAVDGEVGVQMAGAGHDLILMDCSMPRMDGFDATRNIRALPGPERNTPIIALTAHATAEDRERCLAAGMNAWLAKPVSSDQLVATLREFTNWSGPSSAGMRGVLDERLVAQLLTLGGSHEPEFFEGLVQEFDLAAREALREARDHLQSSNLPEVRRAVHRLEGASATIGAVRLREACGKIDAADTFGLLDEGSDWLDLAEQEVQTAVQALIEQGRGR